MTYITLYYSISNKINNTQTSCTELLWSISLKLKHFF